MKPFVDSALRPIDPPVNDDPDEPYLHETDIPKDCFEDGHEINVTVSHNEPDGLSNQKLPWDPAEIRVLKTRISA